VQGSVIVAKNLSKPTTASQDDAVAGVKRRSVKK